METRFCGNGVTISNRRWFYTCCLCQKKKPLLMPIRTTVDFEKIVVTYPHNLLPSVLIIKLRLMFHPTGWRRDLLTRIVPSSKMQLFPITIGPTRANIAAFGWTTVPTWNQKLVQNLWYIWGEPAPMVMSPRISTSWHTTALEWIENLSRLCYTW